MHKSNCNCNLQDPDNTPQIENLITPPKKIYAVASIAIHRKYQKYILVHVELSLDGN